MITWLTLALLAATPAAPEAVEEVESADVAEVSSTAEWYSESFPAAERIFDQLTARTNRAGTIEMVITHRNATSISTDPAFNFLGFDAGGLKIGIGLRYGIIDGLDVGVYRTNGSSFDTYEFDGRYQLLTQENNFVDLAVRGGATWFVQKNMQDASGYFGQLLANRVLFERWLISANVSVHSSSSNPAKRKGDTDYTTGASLSSEYRFVDYFGIAAEIASGISGYRDGNMPIITVGPKFFTNRHTFAIVLSNSQALTSDSLITNSSLKNPKDWLLGFNVIREL